MGCLNVKLPNGYDETWGNHSITEVALSRLDNDRENKWQQDLGDREWPNTSKGVCIGRHSHSHSIRYNLITPQY